MKNLIAHYVTHGLSHCLNISSSVLKILDQNKVFSFSYLEKTKLEGKFVLNPSTRKSAEIIKEREINTKGKSVEAKEEVCSSN
jgi:hypothetical protein